jgi:NADH dehydrogenase
MKSNICIVGGGFGGLYTALKISSTLSENDNVEITLIDPKDKFIFLPLLYELAIGGASVLEVAPKYETLLKGSKVNFIQSSVSDIDLNNNQVILADTTSSIKYDQLVLSVGAQPRLDLVPGKKFLSFYHLKLYANFSNIYFVLSILYIDVYN